MEFVAQNLNETKKFATRIAQQLCPGKVVLLFGDLGAGKTTLSKFIIAELGFSGTVTSPTFTIMNEYNGKFKIFHFDMYRIESSAEAEEFGLSEILNSGEGVCILEWPEKVLSLLPKNAITIKIESLGECARRFTVEGI